MFHKTVVTSRDKLRDVSSATFGFQSDPPGTTLTLWRCGVWIVGLRLYSGDRGNTSNPCLHRTRLRARICPNRREYLAEW